jgi:hypothetical protein
VRSADAGGSARRRRRWYSAKSASILIDTDVHLYEYASRPGTSRLTWGGKLGLTRLGDNLVTAPILGAVPMEGTGWARRTTSRGPTGRGRAEALQDVAEKPVKDRP